MINSNTKYVGLFGNPVEHSLSPLFMNYILKNIELNYIYVAFNIKDKDIKDALNSIKILNFKGVNVTIPYKQSVIKYIEKIDKSAKFIGAVNCILNEDNILKGYNTDHLGFIKTLRDRNIIIRNKTALIIGCGGASRSVLYSLVINGISKIYLANRTKENALGFIKWVNRELNFNEISYIGESFEITQSIVDNADVIVNTTPVGMYPETESSPIQRSLKFNKRQVVYDLIYNPWETKLIKASKKSGASAINGFEMLIFQGIYSLSIWFPEKKETIFLMMDKIIDFAKKKFRNRS